ncbi:MAG TPA: glucosaminidase domain-containing protein, partial [Chitinophagaceae bacterium]|nr:glucosaminidase domain-containing protein [Chitinophagaceae bacterium]
MHKQLKNIILALAVLIGYGSQAQQMTAEQYIDTYYSIAVREMLRSGIPASITLAQGLFESGFGNSRLAVEGNNHFGIKCHKEWNGPTIIEDDDALGECFRKYQNPEESYVDHSNFLLTRDRYKFLFNYPPNDYINWASGLKLAGYATNPRYSQELIMRIEKYQLNR